MADFDAIKAELIEFIVEEYVEDESMEIKSDTPLISSGLVDSFSMVSLKMFIEEEYSTELSDEEASTEAFDTVDNILAVLKTKLG